MQATISGNSINGTIPIPPSKSMMQRICAAALLHQGTTTIHNPGTSDDDKAALKIIRSLGATVTKTDTSITVISDGSIHSLDSIDCGESGLSSRLFTPIAALSKEPVTITGHGSLLHRPMQFFAYVLPQLNVSLPHFSGHLPFIVQGPLQSKDITVSGALSSQFLSGLLLALSAAVKEKVIITVTDLKSYPYIDLTLQVLAKFGKHITHHNYETFEINPTNFQLQNEVEITVEGDWSSAAAVAVAAAICGQATLNNMNQKSLQGDRAVLNVIADACGNVMWNTDAVTITQAPLKAFTYDATNTPDLFPVLSILAACATGQSTINGLHRLVHKESNREQSILVLLNALNVAAEVQDDALLITGRQTLQGCTIHSHNDHRIIMAAAIAALRADGPVTITSAEAISKSYPAFFTHLQSLGAHCVLSD